MSSQRQGDSSLAQGGERMPATDLCDADVARRLAEGAAGLPEVGEDFLGFHLVDELGRGAFSRVYLAHQADLADRPVALKVSVDVSGEPQLLARLQHTNIVPIYSAHRAGPLHAVCMPYFGPTTLADVLEDLRGRADPPDSGEALVSLLRDTILQGQTERPVSARLGIAPARARAVGATVTMLRGMDYVRAVLWVGVRLADGLGHAHERGILHRDLKPANVLLSDDGQPMLLDFNLARDTGADAPAARLGGTLPYMAPEQLRAFLGEADAADGRADLYALGVMLCELLTGRRPFPARLGPVAEALPWMIADRLRPPRVRGAGRAVTPAVEAIVRRCLDPDPRRRYQKAQELREDLQCQLDDRPLRHTPEPSLRERVRKWGRRHPRLASPLTALALGLFAAALWAVSAAWQESRHDRARARHAEAQRRAAEGLTRQAEAQRRQADEQKRQAVFAARAVEEFARFRQDAKAAGPLEDELNVTHLLNEAGTPRHSHPKAALARARRALGRFRVLDDPAWQDSPLVRALPEDKQAELREKAGELLRLLAQVERLALTGAGTAGFDPVVQVSRLWGPGMAVWGAFRAAHEVRAGNALRLNRLAAQCYPDGILPRGLRLQKAALLAMLGTEPEAAIVPARAPGNRPETSEELCWAAAELAGGGDFRGALELAQKATQLGPSVLSPWLVRAICHDRLGQYEEAAAAYSICIALKPDFAWGYFYRGKAHLRHRQWGQAREDFDRAMKLRPALTAAALAQRAYAWEELQERKLALTDLDRALALGNVSGDVYALRARLRALAGDREGARQDVAELLRIPPESAEAWLTRGLMREGDDPRAALDDIDRALEMSPSFRAALYHKARLLARPFQRTAEAVQILTRLLELYPDHQDARLKRALLRARLGQRAAAHADAEDVFWHDRSPRSHYLVGAVYAITGRKVAADRGRALWLLGHALRHGYGLKQFPTDPDLVALHGLREFTRLAAAARQLAPEEPPPPSMRPDP